MKILVLLERNPFIDSSAQNNRFLSLAEGLLVNGAEIKLIFIEGYLSTIERKLFAREGSYKGFEYEYISTYNYINPIGRRLLNFFLFPSAISKKILNELVKEKYEYLWIGASAHIVRIALKLLLLKPEVKYFHERSEFSWIGFANDKKLHENYLQNILPNIDALSVMTKTLREYYSQFLNEDAVLIHLPMTVDLSRFTENSIQSKLQKPYIGYCGTMNNKKDGVDILIKAFIEIMYEFPDLHLYLAGSQTPNEDYLSQRKIIIEHDANNRITYLGKLSREEIPSFLSNATLLALARPESKQAEGGFPTKLGEYLASGKPVCVTDVGEIGDYLIDNETVFFAKPGCYVSFSDSMKRSLTSTNALKVGEKGKQVAFDVFNKDIQAKRLYDFLIFNSK